MPLFSVIVPVYNRADLVRQALDSVLAQSCVDFELIVVDDGSCDDTPRVLEAYRDRARLLRQANAGPGAARNLGLAHAHGDYAVFLDSDDLWPPWTLAVLRQVIDEQGRPSIIVQVPVRSGLAPDPTHLRQAELQLEVQDDFLTIGRDMSRFDSSVLPVSQVRTLRAAGGFAARPIAFEDWDLVLRLGQAPGFVTVRSPTLLLYRHHSATETRNSRSLAAGAAYVLAQERVGRYPGGPARRSERRAILCSLCRFAIIRCLLNGDWRLGYGLYLHALRLFFGERRWRLIATLPVLPVIAPGLYRRRDPHFDDSSVPPSLR